MAQIGPLSMSAIWSTQSSCVRPTALLTSDETLEERLIGEVFVMLLEVLLGGSDELDGSKLVPREIQVSR